MLGERGGEIEIDRLICWEDKERDRDRQTYVRGDGREIETDRLSDMLGGQEERQTQTYIC